MQWLMALHFRDVYPLQQPVPLLFVQRQHIAIQSRGPQKALLLKTFVPQAKARAIPVEHFYFVAPAIAEHKQGPAKRGQRHMLFNQQGEPIDTLARGERLAGNCSEQ